MSTQGHHKLVGTCDIDASVALDTLVIPFTSPTVIGTVLGTLLPWVERLSNGNPDITISGSTLTVQMKGDFNFIAGSAFLPKATVEGGAAKWDVLLESWNATTKRFVFRTYNAAGTLAAPVAGVAMHLVAVLRY